MEKFFYWAKNAASTVRSWLRESNRSKHIIGGLLVGFGAEGWYCALYAGTGIAAALEYKDKAHGGKWDWVDLGLTVGGVVLGQLVRQSI